MIQVQIKMNQPGEQIEQADDTPQYNPDAGSSHHGGKYVFQVNRSR
jgi:hypothetical protein